MDTRPGDGAASAGLAGDGASTPTGADDLVEASRQLLPRLWGGEDVTEPSRRLLERARSVRDAAGECGALYVSMAAASVNGDSQASRVAATALVQRALDAGLPTWESLGRTHLAGLHVVDGHENLAIEEVVGAELLVEDLEPTTIVAVALSGIAATYSRLEVYEDSERLYARCAEVLRVAHDAWAEQALIYNRFLNHATWGLALHRAGETETAQERLTVAVEQVRSYGDLSWSRLWCDLATLCLFADLMIGRTDAEGALQRFVELRMESNVESESFARFALAHRYAEAEWLESARGQIELGLAVVHPIEGGAVRSALTWERARIAVLEDPGSRSIQDIWAYAQLATNQVWELRRRRVESVRDRLRIGHLQRQHERAERAAEEDPLTGLANRRRIDRERARIEEGRRPGWVTVAYLDIDRFKPVNDTFGHDLGDAVLKDIAMLLRNNVRSGDLVGRYGGDEFVVIAEDCPPPIAQQLAARILESVRLHDWAALAPDLRVHVSIGVATGRDECGSLISRADDALYTAKRGGRSRAELVVVPPTGSESSLP